MKLFYPLDQDLTEIIINHEIICLYRVSTRLFEISNGHLVLIKQEQKDNKGLNICKKKIIFHLDNFHFE